MSTREENKGREVGKPDMKKRRATKAEMAARRDAVAQAKADKTETHLQAVRKVAAIEDAQEKLDMERKVNANHPQMTDVTRIPRPPSQLRSLADG
jgi:hypothetical protein